MNSAPPFPSIEEQLAGFSSGDHLCCIYREHNEQMAIAIPYLVNGLENNEKCLYVVDESTADEIIQEFKKAGCDIGRYIDSGQFVILTKLDAYLRDGTFDPDSMISLIRKAETDALAQGYGGLRVTGEMTWVLTAAPGVDRLIEYEAKLNHFFPGSKTTALCQYHEPRFEPNILLDVIHTHPVVAIHGNICTNPYFIPPDEFLMRMKNSSVSLAIYERIRNDILAKDRTKKENRALESNVRELLSESERSRRALLSILEDRNLAEEGKKISEEKYRTLYSSMNEGVALHEIVYNDLGNPIDYIILDVNPAFETITGLQRSAVVGKKATLAYGINDAPYLDVYSRVAATGEPTSFDTHFDPLGKTFTISAFSPARGKFATVFSDITGRKRMEENLRASEEKYRILFETMAQGVVYEDGNGIITSANPSAQSILGLTLDQLNGRTSMDPRWKAIHEDGSDFPGETHPITVALKTGKEVKNVVMGIFNPVREAYSWISVNAVPEFRPGDEKPFRVYSTFEDITEIRNRNAFINTILENLNIGVAVNGIDSGKVEYINPAFCRIYGWPADDLKDVSTFFEKVYPDPEYGTELKKRVMEDLASGDPGRMAWDACIATTKDGEKRIVDARNIPLPDQNLMISTVWDVTDKKEMENSVKNSEALLQRIFEVLPVGLWFADKDGKLQRGNAAGVKIWGAEPKVAPSEYGVFKARRLPSGEEIAPDDWALAHTIREGVTVTDELLEIDAFDGKTKTILNYTAPVNDENGNLQGAIVVNLDVTASKKAEIELERHYDILRLAGKTAKFGGWSVDLKSDIATWSDAVAEIYEMPVGYSPSVEDGINFYAPEWRDLITKVFSDCATKGIPYDKEMEIITSKGKRVWIRTTGEAVRDENDRIILIRGSFQDISIRKQLEEKLKDHNENLLATVNSVSEELEKAHRSIMQQERLAVLGQMAASVSHELRNPLSVINNVAYYLKTKFPDADDKTIKMLELLEKEVDRSDRIIGNMLSFSKLKPTNAENINVNELVSSYLSSSETISGNISVRQKLSDIPPVSADPEKLRQVLDNLVSNACQAMPDGGTLTVSTKVNKAKKLELSVKDTGHGMSEEIQSRIFEPLFSTKTTGFGLGLAIVKTLITDHGGEIKVKSRVGEGSEFIVILPIDRRSV